MKLVRVSLLGGNTFRDPVSGRPQSEFLASPGGWSLEYLPGRRCVVMSHPALGDGSSKLGAATGEGVLGPCVLTGPMGMIAAGGETIAEPGRRPKGAE